jgi:hypothetical protein
MKRQVSTIIPSLAPETEDVALDRLFDPARFFDDPAEIVSAPDLDLPEKRAILSSWASDACAVDSMPALRRPNGARRPVTFDAIMDALRSLDSQAGEDRPGSARFSARQLDA